MAILTDKSLEELRKFLIEPGHHSPEELGLITRDLIWAVEDLQLRRVNERTRIVIDPPKPYLLFGTTEDVLATVERQKIPDANWRHVEKTEDLTHVMPRTVQGLQCTPGHAPELWKAWEELVKTYE